MHKQRQIEHQVKLAELEGMQKVMADKQSKAEGWEAQLRDKQSYTKFKFAGIHGARQSITQIEANP